MSRMSFQRFALFGLILCGVISPLVTSQECINGRWHGNAYQQNYNNDDSIPIDFNSRNRIIMKTEAVQINYQTDSIFSIALAERESLPFWQTLSSNGVIDTEDQIDIGDSEQGHSYVIKLSCNSKCIVDYNICLSPFTQQQSIGNDPDAIRMLSEGNDLLPPPIASFGSGSQGAVTIPDFRASEFEADSSRVSGVQSDEESTNNANLYGSNLLQEPNQAWSRSMDGSNGGGQQPDADDQQSGVSVVTVILGVAGIAVVALLLIICAVQLLWKSEKESPSTSARCSQRPFDRVVPTNETIACAEPSFTHHSTSSDQSTTASIQPIDASEENPYLTSVPPITPGAALSAKC